MTHYDFNGSWCEVCTREKRTYHGRILYKNQVFGRDAKSPFILENIVADADGMHGRKSTICLYRLDMNRGWVEVWEKSETTEWAMWLLRVNNRNARTVRIDRKAKRNALAEVVGTPYRDYSLFG